ncbi:MAG: hypothetical protein K0R67_4019 [Paenibacillus sp.]|nr:hypothetical protein [Paenibacillus sp.]
MIRSMTGFGQAEGTTYVFRIQVELRTVNNRYCEIAVRMPREWLVWEDRVKRTIQPFIKRGRVEVNITCERIHAAARDVEVDWPLVEGYRDAAEQIKARLQLSQSDVLTLRDLLQLPDLIVLRERHSEEHTEELGLVLLNIVREATDRLVSMREAEGNHLSRDISERLDAMERMHRNVQLAAPMLAEEYRLKLKQRIEDLLDERSSSISGLQDENRIAMEVSLLAERSDIQEELTRLNSHFAQCRLLLLTDEPIGRKLDFYIQEMNREVNTIGSKAGKIDIINQVVELKAELEKMREQVQNVE